MDDDLIINDSLISTLSIIISYTDPYIQYSFSMYFANFDAQSLNQSHNNRHFFIRLESDSPIEDFIRLNLANKESQIQKQPILNIFDQESDPEEAFSSQQSHSDNLEVNKNSAKEEKGDRGIIGKNVKPKKNQYDKNIFSNITTVIVKRMLTIESQPKLKVFCQYKQLCLNTFLSYFKQIERTKMRLGTTQIAKFYSNCQISTALKQVFSMYLIDFLREEYMMYIIREGKMNNKQKYMRCATKIMYIPKLSLEDYAFLNQQTNQF